ncbi:4000_t:CDS:1, partial [Diversispora eburnea]
MEEIEIEPEEYFYSQNISFDFADFSENNIQLLNEYTEDSLSERSKNENNNFEIYSNT